MEICKVSTFMDYESLHAQLQIYAKMNVAELRAYKKGNIDFDEFALKIGKEFLEQLTVMMMKMEQSEINLINRDLTY